VSEGLLTVLKFCFLALLYLFLFRVVRIVRLELKPAKVAVPVPPVAAEPLAAAPITKRDAKKESKRERGAAQLYLIDPPARNGEVYALAEEVTVGRAPGCGVVLDDDTFVSQVHARLFRRGRETYVEDLGSTNGTLVNGERISEVTRLQRGDRVQFGNTTAEITK
jgi:pSer/pThr/pTyr-binding forkhead associated (FHA) protein